MNPPGGAPVSLFFYDHDEIMKKFRRRRFGTCCWCFWWSLFLLFMIVYWKSVDRDEEYFDTEVAGVCEDVYTSVETSADGRTFCGVEVRISDCQSADCSILSEPVLLTEERDA